MSALSIARKGSRGFWNAWLDKGQKWQKVFCHDGPPTYDCIGDISYIDNTFSSMGYINNIISPDILYSHIMLKDLLFENSPFISTENETDNFFRLYDRLESESIPIFIVGINRISDKGNDFSMIIDSLSATLNGKLVQRHGSLSLWNPHVGSKVVIKCLNYHVYTINVKAKDVGLPLERQEMTYLIGFKAENKEYLPRPMFNRNVDFSSFNQKVSESIIEPVLDGDVYLEIPSHQVSTLEGQGFNTKFYDVHEGKGSIWLPLKYAGRGRNTSTYIKDGSKHRTISLLEISSLLDVPLMSEGIKFGTGMRIFERYSFTRGLEAILSECSELLSCEAVRSYVVEQFFKNYQDIRPVRQHDNPITIGGMFSGIGGFEYGLSRGLAYKGIPSKVVWDYETNSFSQSIFSKHFPTANPLGDITLNNIPQYTDVITMGFPCPDISRAGLRKGIKEGTRSGLFFPAFKKCMAIQPKIIVMENVDAILRKESSTGLAPFDVVMNAFVEKGWNLEWLIISAKEFGAPHIRRRWFCVAYKQGRYNNVMTVPNKVFNGVGNYPKYGSVINGVVYDSTPRESFDGGSRSKTMLPTPIAVDWSKRPTGGLRMRLQEGISRSVGRDRTYPQKLPDGYEWVKKGGKWKSNKIGGYQEVLSPKYVEWMMGFPSGWVTGGTVSKFDPYTWESGSPYEQLINIDSVGDKFQYKALGNAIVPIIPEFIAYAYLSDILK